VAAAADRVSLNMPRAGDEGAGLRAVVAEVQAEYAPGGVVARLQVRGAGRERVLGWGPGRRNAASCGCSPVRRGEFDGRRSPEEIRLCADAILGRYDDVPVRSYVLILAHRQTRDCLTADTCDAPGVTP
jgi:hypothetical protein